MKFLLFIAAMAFGWLVNAESGSTINTETGAGFHWSVNNTKSLILGSDGTGKSWVVITEENGLVQGLSADNHYWTYDSKANKYTDHGVVDYPKQ